ncbi:hypothetical protein PAXRUDRAFT_16706 [Paxillus rubicundulus Ve08.2h10]|uniref:Unplaced genomic scaffold scaffold_2007, whole genome shotgun sequence n=1 Tax=Paxillus rubicundulus Ve08.2h10 TaxID=930991 RepID=A0A0D0DDF2_9AGAM|nr:hypothetical protein PAXRUDRAFT_17260 [Paxillus rubicundulus Ve08.2h10]KIK78754.1 hypothetical protein PAXRUDRAFT_16706 [Paxillus rubicundulus Ve08.2h10]
MSSRRGPDTVNQFRSFSSCRIDTSASSSLNPPNMPTPPPRDSASAPLDCEPPSDDDPGSDGDRNPFDNDERVPLPPNHMTALANAVCGLADITRRNLTSEPSQHTKVQEPDTFNGTNTCKLYTFIVQCELNFQDRPCAFWTDRAKVTFAQSYLKGMALKWFEPDLLHAEDLDLYAEHQLDNLSMKDSQHINKYVVEFNHITSQVCGYRDSALCHHFYSGLLDRIKDEIARVGKPTTLTELRILSQGIDAHYWECKSKLTRQAKPTNPPLSKPHTSSPAKSAPNPASVSSFSPAQPLAEAR